MLNIEDKLTHSVCSKKSEQNTKFLRSRFLDYAEEKNRVLKNGTRQSTTFSFGNNKVLLWITGGFGKSVVG